MNSDGVVTFEEANGVLPFANNVNYVDVTGATLKTILEQQWQRTAAGAVPSRPFLQLGLSKNMRVTLDPARPEGDRVTSVLVNGVPTVAGQKYKVATFSFLAQGGDNFRAFKEGTVTDTGVVDRDLWIDGFFRNGQPKEPSFSRQQVYTDMPRTVLANQPASSSC